MGSATPSTRRAASNTSTMIKIVPTTRSIERRVAGDRWISAASKTHW